MKPYYEGWYMKQQQGEDVLAVIPGRAQDSAFIQVVSNRGSRFLPYPLEAFDRTDGSMRIGDSLFTPYGMQLRIDEPDFEFGRKRSLRSSAAAALGHHGAVRLRAHGNEAYRVQHAAPGDRIDPP